MYIAKSREQFEEVINKFAVINNLKNIKIISYPKEYPCFVEISIWSEELTKKSGHDLVVDCGFGYKDQLSVN